MIPFVKAHADGNDFLIIEERYAADRASITRALCDRHTGVGADGIEWVQEEADGLAAELTNADGSFAEISGNGTRCVAAWWAMQHSGSRVSIRTGAGERECEVLSRGASCARIRTEMGIPQWRTLLLHANGAEFVGIFVDLGNPHFVLTTDKIPADWQAIGALLTANEAFPAGANIEFLRRISDEEIEFRIYERGVGPTQSSGTGSAASAVAAIVGGASHSLKVRSPGGLQQVEWRQRQPLLLIGDAHLVARGEAWAR